MQVIRRLPNRESQMHLSSAAPVSSPLHMEATALVFSQLATQGGAPCCAMARRGRVMKIAKVGFMVMVLWKSGGRLEGRSVSGSVLCSVSFFVFKAKRAVLGREK